MDEEMKRRIGELERKVDAVFVTTEKIRKYLFWTLIITVVLVVLPAIGLVFAVPSFMSQYSSISSMGDLTQ